MPLSQATAVRTGPLLFGLYLLGMLCLPMASFEKYRDLPEDWLYVVGEGLAFDNPLNRGLVMGLVVGGLACVYAIWTRKFPRGHWLDAIIVAWILTPLAAGLLNPSLLRYDLFQTIYLVAVWGGPYLAARLTVQTTEEIQHCLWGLVILGLFTALPALFELTQGRFVYRSLYGYHPSQNIGGTKFFGTRPLLCFEDPNQIAMWWFTVAMAAVIVIPVWFARTRTTGMKAIAVSLPFLFQGIGASILTVVGIALFSPRRVVHWRPILIVIVVASFLMFLARGPILRLGREMAQKSGIEQPIKSALRDSAIGSLAWRMVREEEGSQTVESHPLFGWGTVMFWVTDGVKFRPWGMVSLVNGAYGFVGAVLLIGWFFLPALCHWFFVGGSERSRVRYGVALLWGLHGVDALVNPAFFLPMVFLLGAAAFREPD